MIHLKHNESSKVWFRMETMQLTKAMTARMRVATSAQRLRKISRSMDVRQRDEIQKMCQTNNHGNTTVNYRLVHGYTVG